MLYHSIMLIFYYLYITLSCDVVEGDNQCELGVITTQSEATLLYCNPDAKLPINPSGTLQQPTPHLPHKQTHTHTQTHSKRPWLYVRSVVCPVSAC